MSEISRPQLASVAVQADLSLPWSQTPKTGFLLTRLKWDCCNDPKYWDRHAWANDVHVDTDQVAGAAN